MRKRSLILLLALVVAGFVAGTAYLIGERFDVGDVYPPYSSLRSDPLGTRVLYEALGATPGTEVSRNYQPLKRMLGAGSAAPASRPAAGEGRTLLVLGLGMGEGTWRRGAPSSRPGPATQPHGPTSQPDANDDEEDAEDAWLTHREGIAESLMGFVSAGGHLVIALRPGWPELWSLPDRLGFLVEGAGQVGPGDKAVPAPGQGALGGEIPWRSGVYFSRLAPAWRTLYTCNSHPVIIVRSFGRGSVALSADSFLFSNEAMRVARQPRLLSRLVGGGRLVFDETHFGVVEQVGTATLARRYHLEGVLAALVVLAGLFVWKNAASFIPRGLYDAGRRGGPVRGRDAGASLLNLLRKSIPPDSLLSVCLQEWRKSSQPGDRRRAQQDKRIDAMVAEESSRPRRQRNPVAAYRSICRALTERKAHGVHR